MRTRCPVCSTAFRVTSEQLRLRAGKVRCGHCQAVFNAFDDLENGHLLADSAPDPITSTPEPIPTPAPAALVDVEPVSGALPVSEPLPAEPVFPVDPPAASTAIPPDEEPSLASPSPQHAAEAVAEVPAETLEESTLAAREAGLVAVRDLIDTPAYNRWAEGTLASSGLGGFDNETSHRATWPFVLVSLLLVTILLIQLLYFFRTELAQRLPSSAALFEIAAVDVPLPRNSDLVSIETSDLQSDLARGLFVLQATLHNGAGYSQAWPALELTLTDVSDTVLSRRVLLASDYLPAATDSRAFSANGELAIRLWIESKGVAAAGYRLYVFYP